MKTIKVVTQEDWKEQCDLFEQYMQWIQDNNIIAGDKVYKWMMAAGEQLFWIDKGLGEGVYDDWRGDDTNNVLYEVVCRIKSKLENRIPYIPTPENQDFFQKISKLIREGKEVQS